MKNRSIIVVAEHHDGITKPITYELLTLAKKIQRFHPAELRIVVLGDDVKALAERIAGSTGVDVIGIQNAHLKSYNGEIYKTIVGRLIIDWNAAYVCIPQISRLRIASGV